MWFFDIRQQLAGIMLASFSDVASLRQRVLDSLAKKGADTPISSIDDEIEEGEIQEAVDASIRSKTQVFMPENRKALAPTTMAHFPMGIPGSIFHIRTKSVPYLL